MKNKTKPISIPTICELYSTDPSQLRRMLNKIGIEKTKVRRAEDNKVVTVISDEDHQRLIDSYPCLTSKKASKSDVSVATACELLKYKKDQVSNFIRACKSWGIEVYEKKFEGRTQNCISRKDFLKASKLRTLAVVDVD